MVYLAIGWPALLSLAILCLAIPVQFLLTRMLVHNREVLSPVIFLILTLRL